jgi:long-subunit fatty acid transport protein
MAAFHEQLIVDARALSLANSVTADPENIMSIHFNPAGLASLNDGSCVSVGMGIIKLDVFSEFLTDPEYPPLFNTFENDPLSGKGGRNDGLSLYIPYIGSIDIPFYAGPVSVGVSHRKKESRWTFASGFYLPYAGGYYHDSEKNPTRFDAEKVYLERMIYSAPTCSYRINDDLSVGFGIGAGQNTMGISIQIREPNEMVALTKALGDSSQGADIPIFSNLILPAPWFGGGVSPFEPMARLDTSMKNNFAPTYNLGIQWTPKDYFSFGAVYQSGSNSQLTGKYAFQYSEDWQSMISWFSQGAYLPTFAKMLDLPMVPKSIQSGNVVMEADFPRRIQTGIMVRPFRRFKLFCDAKWSQWSVVKENRMIFDQDIQLLSFMKLMGYLEGSRQMVITRYLKDTLHFGFGAELAASENLFLRAGYEFRPTSMRRNRFDLMYFMPDMNVYSIGLGYHFKNGAMLDLGASYQVNSEYTVPNSLSGNLNGTDFTKPVYTPYAGLDYRQETSIYLCALNITMPMNAMQDIVQYLYSYIKNTEI